MTKDFHHYVKKIFPLLFHEFLALHLIPEHFFLKSDLTILISPHFVIVWEFVHMVTSECCIKQNQLHYYCLPCGPGVLAEFVFCFFFLILKTKLHCEFTSEDCFLWNMCILLNIPKFSHKHSSFCFSDCSIFASLLFESSLFWTFTIFSLWKKILSVMQRRKIKEKMRETHHTCLYRYILLILGCHRLMGCVRSWWWNVPSFSQNMLHTAHPWYVKDFLVSPLSSSLPSPNLKIYKDVELVCFITKKLICMNKKKIIQLELPMNLCIARCFYIPKFSRNAKKMNFFFF